MSTSRRIQRKISRKLVSSVAFLLSFLSTLEMSMWEMFPFFNFKFFGPFSFDHWDGLATPSQWLGLEDIVIKD